MPGLGSSLGLCTSVIRAECSAGVNWTIAHKWVQPLGAIVQEAQSFARYDPGCASGGDAGGREVWVFTTGCFSFGTRGI
jgi:hypothetical protein